MYLKIYSIETKFAVRKKIRVMSNMCAKKISKSKFSFAVIGKISIFHKSSQILLIHKKFIYFNNSFKKNMFVCPLRPTEKNAKNLGCDFFFFF